MRGTKDRPISAVILAAGLGTRMRSRRPKVLHPIAGKPMIDHVLGACLEAGAAEVLAVLSPRQPEVAEHVRGRCRVVFQEEQLGTGHALLQLPEEVFEGDLLVLNGDAPLLRPATIARLLATHRSGRADATLAVVVDPARNDGRILRRPDGGLDRIVEAKEATPQERALTEVNVGLYCFAGPPLRAALAELRPDNRAGELYLTDVFAHLGPAAVVTIEDAEEAIGVNDRVELARAESVMRRRLLERLMLSGVTVVDPASTFVDAGVEVGEDTVLEPFTLLRGATRVGAGCRIGPFAQLFDCEVGDGCVIDRSWVSGTRIEAGADCGPFSKLRPGTWIGPDVHVGSFAEIVRSRIGARSKVPHVSYLGDAIVGEDVNIGAGSITANFDGVEKRPTVIEDGVFVGVDTMMRAPVRLGKGSRTGAGSVVTKDVPAGALAVGVPARVLRRPTAEGKSR